MVTTHNRPVWILIRAAVPYFKSKFICIERNRNLQVCNNKKGPYVGEICHCLHFPRYAGLENQVTKNELEYVQHPADNEFVFRPAN